LSDHFVFLIIISSPEHSSIMSTKPLPVPLEPPAFPNLRLLYGERLGGELPWVIGTDRSGLTPRNLAWNPDMAASTSIGNQSKSEIADNKNRLYQDDILSHQDSADKNAMTRELRIRLEENVQRQRMYGRTSHEIYEAGGFGNSYLKPCNLDNPICPLYDRHIWLSGTESYFGGTGYWEAANDDIWEILLPSLRLASLLIVNSHIFPW
jgi:hypothetical protein